MRYRQRFSFHLIRKIVMRRRITHVILLLLSISICAGILAGCDSRSENREGFVVEPLPKEEYSEKELGWMTLQENLRPSILRITCGGYTGSGVVWEITKEKVTVASSGHLLKNAEVCEVECYAGIYYEAKVEKILEDCDIGFAVFPAEALREDEVELIAVEPLGEGRNLIRGEELAIYGSMENAAENFVKGYLIEVEREIQIDGYEKPQVLMLGGILRESSEEGDTLQREQEGGTEPEKAQEESSALQREQEDGTEPEKEQEESGALQKGQEENISEKGLVDAGMSGSGVFDRQGRLLGILAGGDGKQGFVAVPIWRFMH